MFFNLAIKQRYMYPEYIFKMLHIYGDFRGIFHFSYIINQKTKKICESLPPSHITIFTKILYMYLYKEYYVEWGSWYMEGTMLQRQKNKQTNKQTNKNASRGRYHICTEINRSLDNWLSIFV